MLKLLELFGGIGACSKAIERLGIDYEIVDYVEIDKYAVKSFNAIHGTDFIPQDIREWNKDIKVDLIMHGSPCQDFSVAGKGAGGDEGSGTRSSLMYETIRIVNKLKPKYVIWENVKNLLSKKHIHNFNNYLHTMNGLGYNSYYQVLNSKDYGIPQNRERVFTISIRSDIDNGTFTFPKPFELKLKLKDMLESNVDEKYYISDKMMQYIISKDDKYKVNEQKLVINRDIACSKTTREGNTRADTTDYICDEAPNNYNLLLIKNNTKQGYLEAQAGDGVYTNPTTKRGTVQKQMIPTITSFQDKGVVVKEEIKEKEKYCKYCGKQLERKRFNGRLEDFTAFKNRKYCNRECMKRAYLKIGENEQSYSNAHTTARKINELILHKETCELCGSDKNLDIHHIDGNWKNNNINNLMCLCRSCHTKYERNKGKIGGDEPIDDRLRIRKLTPKECWRL